MAEVLTLSHVGLRAPDVQRTARFYASVVGLVETEAEASGRARLGVGAGGHALELAGGTGLDHVALAVGDGALAGFQERLAAHGVHVEWEQPWGDHPRVLAFADPDGHRIELHEPVDRSGEAAAGGGALRPLRIHHVTFASPQLDRMVDFYVEALGFRVSDTMGGDDGDVFTWLRCNREHHTVAVVRGERAGLDHYAFEIASWAELGRWCDELAAADVPLTWGPGRHGPGNNLFAMFDDVDGRRVELSCEMERFWDDRAAYPRVPRRWAPQPTTVNLWGPTPTWRSP